MTSASPVPDCAELAMLMPSSMLVMCQEVLEVTWMNPVPTPLPTCEAVGET